MGCKKYWRDVNNMMTQSEKASKGWITRKKLYGNSGIKNIEKFKQTMSKLKKGKSNPHTEEWNKKISKSKLKNPTRYWLGKTFSDIHKQKIGEFRKDRPLSKEHKNNISNSNKGRIFTEEHKRKLRLSNTGKKRSLETRQKLSESHKLFYNNHPGYKPWNYIDGRSKILGPARYGDDWDNIRYLIYLRDKFTCQDCGITGISLDVHHIKPFLISRDNSLTNLISLCRSCHMKRERNLIMEYKNSIVEV